MGTPPHSPRKKPLLNPPEGGGSVCLGVGAHLRVRPPLYMITVKYVNNYCLVLMRAHTEERPYKY